MEPTNAISTAVSDKNFRWDIPHFKYLPKKAAFFIESPLFLWRNSTWCLRLYPNGEFPARPRWISLQLVRHYSLYQDQIQHVHVTLRILTRNGSVLKEISRENVFDEGNKFCGGPLESVDKSRAVMEQRQPGFFVSLSCTMQFVGTNEGAAGTSRSHGMERTILTAVSDNNFRWDIPNFSSLPKEVRYPIGSPLFLLRNATWRLQLYPNGVFTARPRWMCLELVREHLRHHSQIQRVHVTLSIMTSSGSVLKEINQFHVFDNDSKFCGGPLNSVDRSRAEMEQRLPDSFVSFSCTLEFPRTNDSRAGTSH